MLSDRKSPDYQTGNNCQTRNKGRGRPRLSGISERLTFRLRRGTEHNEVLIVLDSLPERAKSAWVANALLCYVRGEIRDVQQETAALSEDLASDLFGMFDGGE